MTLLAYTYVLLASFLVTFSVLIFLQFNPVYSIFYLILCFCVSAGILFCLNVPLFGIFFILIYVGAIAVLFLFVVMMVDLKAVKTFKFTEARRSLFNYIVGFILTVNYMCYFLVKKCYTQTTFINADLETYTTLRLYNDFSERIENSFSLLDMNYIGQSLYNEYGVAVFLAGFMLFLALLISVCLTIDFKKNFGEASKKAQEQLSRLAS